MPIRWTWRAFSLVELVVCVALLGLVVGFVINLIPGGALGTQRATDLSAASAYGADMLNLAMQSLPAPATSAVTDVNASIVLGHSTFQVTRTWYPVPSTQGQLVDVVISLQGPRGSPLTLGTRVAASAH